MGPSRDAPDRRHLPRRMLTSPTNRGPSQARQTKGPGSHAMRWIEQWPDRNSPDPDQARDPAYIEEEAVNGQDVRRRLEACLRLARHRLRQITFVRRTIVQERIVARVIELLLPERRHELLEMVRVVMTPAGIPNFKAAARVVRAKWGIAASDKTIADVWDRMVAAVRGKLMPVPKSRTAVQARQAAAAESPTMVCGCLPADCRSPTPAASAIHAKVKSPPQVFRVSCFVGYPKPPARWSAPPPRITPEQLLLAMWNR